VIPTQPTPDEAHSDPEWAPLVQPFPRPGPLVQDRLEKLLRAAVGIPVEQAENMLTLERPWDPGACTGALRRELWHWLDHVAFWINTQHLWNAVGPGVPECWTFHPHVVHDLAVIACARYIAARSSTPTAMDEWHRYTLPLFLDRLDRRLGEGCPPGRHAPRPRADRDLRWEADAHQHHQEARFRGDLIAAAFAALPAKAVRIYLDLTNARTTARRNPPR
jgi:hypothetical protein